MLSLATSIVTIIGFHLVAKKRWEGWAVGLANQAGCRSRSSRPPPALEHESGSEATRPPDPAAVAAVDPPNSSSTMTVGPLRDDPAPRAAVRFVPVSPDQPHRTRPRGVGSTRKFSGIPRVSTSWRIISSA